MNQYTYGRSRRVGRAAGFNRGWTGLRNRLRGFGELRRLASSVGRILARGRHGGTGGFDLVHRHLQGADIYTMNCLTVVFLGMTTRKPGQANMLGTVVGVLFMGILNNGLNLVGAPFYAQNIIRGAVLIAAVTLAVSCEEIRLM